MAAEALELEFKKVLDDLDTDIQASEDASEAAPGNQARQDRVKRLVEEKKALRRQQTQLQAQLAGGGGGQAGDLAGGPTSVETVQWVEAQLEEGKLQVALVNGRLDVVALEKTLAGMKLILVSVNDGVVPVNKDGHSRALFGPADSLNIKTAPKPGRRVAPAYPFKRLLLNQRMPVF